MDSPDSPENLPSENDENSDDMSIDSRELSREEIQKNQES